MRPIWGIRFTHLKSWGYAQYGILKSFILELEKLAKLKTNASVPQMQNIPNFDEYTHTQSHIKQVTSDLHNIHRSRHNMMFKKWLRNCSRFKPL